MKEYKLNVETPRSFAFVKRNISKVTVEQRVAHFNLLIIMNLHSRQGWPCKHGWCLRIL